MNHQSPELMGMRLNIFLYTLANGNRLGSTWLGIYTYPVTKLPGNLVKSSSMLIGTLGRALLILIMEFLYTLLIGWEEWIGHKNSLILMSDSIKSDLLMRCGSLLNNYIHKTYLIHESFKEATQLSSSDDKNFLLTWHGNHHWPFLLFH